MQNTPKSTARLRAALYLRVSTDEQAKEGYGLVYQEEKLRAFVTSQGYILQEHHLYRDEGFSGSLTVERRPELKRLFDDARTKSFDVVLVYRLDRLFRQTRLLLEALERLNGFEVGVRSITEPFDTTNITGRFMTTLLGAIAEMERDTIRERTMSGRIAAAKAGRWPTGVPPYGYRYNKSLKRLEIVPEEAKWVQQFYEWLVYDRLSLREVQQRTNDLGIPPPKHGKTRRHTLNYWHKRTMGRILVNEAYTGRAYYRKYKRPFKNLTSLLDPGHQRDEKDWIAIDVPPIISRALFDAAKDQLLRNREWSRRNRKRQYLFSQLLYCGYCGFKLFGGYQPPRKAGQEGTKYYHGVYRQKGEVGDTNRCNRCYQVAETRLAPVWETLRVLLERPEYICEQLKGYLGQKTDQGKIKEEIAHIDRQLALLTVRRQRLAQAYAEDPGMGLEFYRDLLRECQAQEHRLHHQRNQFAQSVVSQKELEEQVETIKRLYARLRTELATATYETKQRVIRLLVNKVMVYARENEVRVEVNLPKLNVQPLSSSVEEGMPSRILQDPSPENSLAIVHNSPLQDTDLDNSPAIPIDSYPITNRSRGAGGLRPLILKVPLISVTERRQTLWLTNLGVGKRAEYDSTAKTHRQGLKLRG